MIVFLMLFFVYLSERVRLPALYRASAAELMPMFGLTNALLLVTSSQFMAEAVHAIRAQEADTQGRNYCGAPAAGWRL